MTLEEFENKYEKPGAVTDKELIKKTIKQLLKTPANELYSSTAIISMENGAKKNLRRSAFDYFKSVVFTNNELPKTAGEFFAQVNDYVTKHPYDSDIIYKYLALLPKGFIVNTYGHSN